MRLLSATVLLALACYPRAGSQPVECPKLTKDILIETDESTGRSLIIEAYNRNLFPTNPFILVDDIHIVCEAVGSKRDTYRFVSVVVRQNCSGVLCPSSQRDTSALVQYDFQCSSSGEWMSTVFMSNDIREDDPVADFDTELRESCGLCYGRAVGADPVTHCRRK